MLIGSVGATRSRRAQIESSFAWLSLSLIRLPARVVIYVLALVYLVKMGKCSLTGRSDQAPIAEWILTILLLLDGFQVAFERAY